MVGCIGQSIGERQNTYQRLASLKAVETSFSIIDKTILNRQIYAIVMVYSFFSDLSLYNSYDDTPPCPKGLMIPDHVPASLPSTTPPPPPTGKPGATGATGPTVSFQFQTDNIYI